MTHNCIVSNTISRVFDPYSAFETPYQKKLLELFKAGASLFVWRGTCPHNYFLETTDGTQYIVAGDRESCELQGTGNAQRDALLRLARPVFASPQVISGGSRYENGQPELEGWSFDADMAQTFETRWSTFQEEKANRLKNVTTPKPALEKLSAMALALLRKLKSKDISVVNHASLEGVGRYPELESAFKELDAQGLLKLTDFGYFGLVPSMAKLRVPRGPILKLI